MERKMFDTPVLPRLETILAEVKSGDLVVPEFQRPFVWDDDRRLNLLDSIAAGMPIGSLLVWRTATRELQTYPKIGGISLAGPRTGGEKLNYLIDGHQRVSTLFGALYAGARDSDEDDDGTRWPLYFELGTKARPAFRVPPRRGAVPPHWLPLDIVLDGEKLFEFTRQLREEGKRDAAREAERLANVFRDYIIPIVPLVTEDLNVVTDAFVRINSQGKGMSEAHMLRALAYLQIDMDRHFAEVRERLEPLGWAAVDDQVLVNVLKAQLNLDVYASDVRGVFDKLKADRAPLDRLADVLVEAVEFLASIGVRGPGALPYNYQLVTLAALAAEFPRQLGIATVQDTLRHWFWLTTYTGFFSGATGSRIREGIQWLGDALRTGALAYKPGNPVIPLEPIRLGTGRTRAFLLFLADLPSDGSARQRRQEWLGTGDDKTVPTLVAGKPGGKPSGKAGNRVIANPAELRMLRAAVKKRDIQPSMADEYGIPPAAVDALRRDDLDGFLQERNVWLIALEKAFIESLGLEASDNA